MSYLLLDFSKTEEFKTSEEGDIIFFGTDENPLTGIMGFNSINFFVGQNNSGKSKFLRGILKNKLYIHSTNNTLIWLRNCITELDALSAKLTRNRYVSSATINLHEGPPRFSELIKKYGPGLLVELIAEVKTNVIDLEKTFFENKEPEAFNLNIEFLKILFKFILYVVDNEQNQYRSDFQYRENDFVFYYNDYLRRSLENLNITVRNIADSFEAIFMSPIEAPLPPKKIFIPTLRTTHSLFANNGNPTKLESDVFANSIIVNYKFDFQKHLADQKIIIHTGLDLYKEIKETRAGHAEERDLHSEFEKFIRVHFFPIYENITISSIDKPDTTKRHITVRFGNGKDRDIHYLGDGINSLINILYPIFTCPEGSWIFIEEPEVNLHPGMQRIFIQALLSSEYLKNKNLVYFITTHSNHLLDLGANENEVSIYTFSKIKENHHVVTNVKNRDISILTLLGAQNSSVYLANCTLWVEGITDKIYLSAYLKCYVQHLTKEVPITRTFDEDLHYSFFLYGGSNIVHYLFKEKFEEIDEEQKSELDKIKAGFLSNRIMLIADKDKGKEARHELFAHQQSTKFKFETLQVKEVENLLSAEFLRQNLHLVLKSISQEDINKIQFHRGRLKNKYLGRYILECAKNAGVELPKSFEDSSGTINSRTYKKLLAETARDNMTWELMTDEARELAKRLYEFIAFNNSDP